MTIQLRVILLLIFCSVKVLSESTETPLSPYDNKLTIVRTYKKNDYSFTRLLSMSCLERIPLTNLRDGYQKLQSCTLQRRIARWDSLLTAQPARNCRCYVFRNMTSTSRQNTFACCEKYPNNQPLDPWKCMKQINMYSAELRYMFNHKCLTTAVVDRLSFFKKVLISERDGNKSMIDREKFAELANDTENRLLIFIGEREERNHILCMTYLKPGGLLTRPMTGHYYFSSVNVQHSISNLLRGDYLHRRTGQTCEYEEELLRQILVMWICTKLNLALLALNLAYVLIIWCFLFNKSGRAYGMTRYRHWFAMTDIVWIIWRCQESVHLDTQWRDHLPYLCIITNYVCYICQTGSLYMMSISSYERFQAIARPLLQTNKRAVTTLLMISSGFLVGFFTSSINLANILTMTDPSAPKTCHMRNSKMTEQSLLFVVLCKILNLVLVYIFPAILLICCNIATLVFINRKAHLQHSCTTRKYKETLNYNLGFIVLCSLGIICCLPKPILELLMAQKMYSSTDGEMDRSMGEVIADGVFMNLTVIAFMLNTAVGMRYSV